LAVTVRVTGILEACPPLAGEIVTVPVYVPAARLLALAIIVTVAGVLVLLAFVLSQLPPFAVPVKRLNGSTELFAAETLTACEVAKPDCAVKVTEVGLAVKAPAPPVGLTERNTVTDLD